MKIDEISEKFNLSKPIVVADAGLLSKDNILNLEAKNYQYILEVRIKNESQNIKEQILATTLKNEEYLVLEKGTTKIIVQYSDKRAKKDEHNRNRGLQRLEKQIKSKKLTKQNINNRGYNKYLQMEGELFLQKK